MALLFTNNRLIDWTTDEERLRIKEFRIILSDREMYKKEVFSYVYGDYKIPVELMINSTDIKRKYLQLD